MAKHHQRSQRRRKKAKMARKYENGYENGRKKSGGWRRNGEMNNQ
jgi:hypothetical protein